MSAHHAKRLGLRFPRLENADQSSLLLGVMVVLALLTIFFTTREYPAQPPANSAQYGLTKGATNAGPVSSATPRPG